MKRSVTMAMVALVLAACGSARGTGSIEVTLDEWEIGLSNSRFVDGPVELNVANSGEFPHTLVVEGPGGEVVAATEVIPPGSTGELQLDLAEEDFRFTCRIVATTDDGTVVDHFAEGMSATIFSAGPPPSQ